MNMFQNYMDEKLNLLPKDGTVNYFGKIMSDEKANHYYDVLMETIQWKNDEAKIFGKHIITKRKAAWYADGEYSYTYSNTTKYALPWTKELLQLKKIVEEKSDSISSSRRCRHEERAILYSPNE